MAQGQDDQELDRQEEVLQETPEEQSETQTPEGTIGPEVLEGEGTGKTVTISDTELIRLTEEARSYKDKYLRALADGENLRKRMSKEKEEYSKYTLANTIVEFLHPLDNLEKALTFAEAGSEEVKNWALGFEMILTQFKDVLAFHGVAPIPTQGVAFDPHEHEAVEVVESDELPPGTILEEFTRGYKMGDRTIRPARVKTSRKPQPSAPKAPETPVEG